MCIKCPPTVNFAAFSSYYIMSQAHLSEQELVRREKLAKLVEAGIDPFPAPLYPVTHYSTDIKDHFTEETKEQFASVCVAGRIMSINDKGKVFFIKIQDSKGLIQLYVKRDDLYPGKINRCGIHW